MSLGREFLDNHAFDTDEGIEPGIYLQTSADMGSQVVQDDLFGALSKKTYVPSTPRKAEQPKAAKPTPRHDVAPKTIPKTKPDNYTYADYMRFHCGNKNAASFWYNKAMEKFRKQSC